LGGPIVHDKLFFFFDSEWVRIALPIVTATTVPTPAFPSTQTGFGALTYTTSPPTGLLGVGLGGDGTQRMIAFQLRLEF
jgi:hypothetical protein